MGSFAYERRAELVDTNVARVLERVFAPDARSEVAAATRSASGRSPRALLPRTGAATWTHNQALMELGALVCTARVGAVRGVPGEAVCATWEAVSWRVGSRDRWSAS